MGAESRFKAVVAVLIFLMFSVVALSLKKQEKETENYKTALAKTCQELEIQKNAADSILTCYGEGKRRADADQRYMGRTVRRDNAAGAAARRQAGVLPDL